MVLSKRQLSIINRIMTSSEPVDIRNMALIEGVTPQTIYNDLHLIENIRISVNRGRIGTIVDEDQNSVIKHKISQNRAIREKSCDYVINNLIIVTLTS